MPNHRWTGPALFLIAGLLLGCLAFGQQQTCTARGGHLVHLGRVDGHYAAECRVP